MVFGHFAWRPWVILSLKSNSFPRVFLGVDYSELISPGTHWLFQCVDSDLFLFLVLLDYKFNSDFRWALDPFASFLRLSSLGPEVFFQSAFAKIPLSLGWGLRWQWGRGGSKSKWRWRPGIWRFFCLQLFWSLGCPRLQVKLWAWFPRKFIFLLFFSDVGEKMERCGARPSLISSATQKFWLETL